MKTKKIKNFLAFIFQKIVKKNENKFKNRKTIEKEKKSRIN